VGQSLTGYTIHSRDLRSNQIGSIRDGLFSELKLESLTSLLLDNNQLTEISSGTFIGIPELTTLQLNENQISVINDRAFAGLPHLTNLSA
jgi:Leucine-rich repeat (LRR) protein